MPAIHVSLLHRQRSHPALMASVEPGEVACTKKNYQGKATKEQENELYQMVQNFEKEDTTELPDCYKYAPLDRKEIILMIL